VVAAIDKIPNFRSLLVAPERHLRQCNDTVAIGG
jgi:hypothetical protein